MTYMLKGISRFFNLNSQIYCSTSKYRCIRLKKRHSKVVELQIGTIYIFNIDSVARITILNVHQIQTKSSFHS